MSASSHSRVNTERTRPPRTTTSAGSSPRATASLRKRSSLDTARRFSHDGEVRFAPVDVLTPRSLEEALRLKAERPDIAPIQGGTDVMVELNFDRARPAGLLNLNEVAELRGWSHRNGTVWLGSGLTYAEAMERPLAEALPALAEAARTVGGPQIRNRGTIGGNLGTASPAGDALPPLLIGRGEGELASVGGGRRPAPAEVPSGPRRDAPAGDRLFVWGRS